jgi:hypothetical protein
VARDAALDQELLALPRPPRAARTATLVLMAITVLGSLWLGWSLRFDVRYLFVDDDPVVLPPLAQAPLSSDLEGRFVRSSVALDGAVAASFRRPLDPDVFALARAGDDRWVIYRVPGQLAGPRFVPPRLVAGRLAKFSSLGPRFAGVAGALGAPADHWVVIDGEVPDEMGWLLGLEVMLLGCAIWLVSSAVTILRPPRHARRAAARA